MQKVPHAHSRRVWPRLRGISLLLDRHRNFALEFDPRGLIDGRRIRRFGYNELSITGRSRVHEGGRGDDEKGGGSLVVTMRRSMSSCEPS